MSFGFPGGRTPRNPRSVPYHAANAAFPTPHSVPCPAGSASFPRTPDPASRRTTPNSTPYPAGNTAFPRTPDAASRHTADQQPLHKRAPRLRGTPQSDGSNPPFQLHRLPSFSSISQPVFHSPSYHRSRAVSSTTRQQKAASATPMTVVSPRVNGSGIVSSSGRARTVSCGSSMRPSVPNTYTTPSPSLLTRLRKAIGAPGSDQHIKPDNGNQIPQYQNAQSSTVIQQHPMLKDIALVAAVAAARTDNQEFLWYPVWVIAVKDWLFFNSNTATVACNIAPQFVLECWYKRNRRAKAKKLRKVPDFAQVLQHVNTLSNGTQVLGRQKVILMVENKATFPRVRWLRGQNPFEITAKQVEEQAIFAFLGDHSLLAIGIITACGSRWRYVEVDRPRTKYLKKWMDVEIGDATYTREKPVIELTVPEELKRISPMTDGSFELLDHMGLSAQAFDIIARRVKSRERDMWNL